MSIRKVVPVKPARKPAPKKHKKPQHRRPIGG